MKFQLKTNNLLEIFNENEAHQYMYKTQRLFVSVVIYNLRTADTIFMHFTFVYSYLVKFLGFT